MELTQISVELEMEEKKNENFEYEYALVLPSEVVSSAEFILKSIKLETFIVTLIKIILTLCYQNNPSDESLELVLNYLHYLVTFKSYHYA